jgi:hypothetical protein
MNKRIKELAEQAGIEFTYDPTEVPMRAFVEAWEEDLEKFAELIVRECAKIVNENDCEGSIVGDGMLFDHFGVEE